MLPGESARVGSPNVKLDTDQSYSSRPILIEDGASNYLKNELDIDVRSLSGSGSKLYFQM